MEAAGGKSDVVDMLFDLGQLLVAGVVSFVWVRSLRDAALTTA
jgi:hypothetical protein